LAKSDRIAELQTKRLALFDDQERYMGNLSNFRSLTGGGKISGRKLYKDAINFTFNGLALITANQPCFPASGISWLKRRIIQQEFRHHPSKPNVYLQKQLEPELSSFTRHLLSIPVAEIERILSPESTGLNLTFWEDRIQADPLASWINDHIIHEVGAETAIGSDKDEWKDGNYDATRSTLFGGYNLTCRQSNSIPLSKNKFSANLVELCQSVLGWRDVAKIRKGDARYIVGIRFRTDADSAIPTLDQVLNDDDRCHNDDLNVNPKPIQNMACADLDNLLSKVSEKNTSTEEIVQKMNFQSDSPNDVSFIEKFGELDANVSTTQSQQGNGSTLESSSTLSNGSSQSRLLLLQQYTRHILEAIGYQFPAIANAIAPSELETPPPEPTAQSVSPIAPPESVIESPAPIVKHTDQKPERKTDDRVVAGKKRHQEFSIGDRVVIVEDSIHNGQRGEIIAGWTGDREIDYQIKLDKASHNQPVVIVHVPKGPHVPVLMQLKAEGGALC
jgi:hypothetical protein